MSIDPSPAAVCEPGLWVKAIQNQQLQVVPGFVAVQPSLSEDRSVSEVGRQAVWSVTSAKPGNGVDLLRDGKEDTYWQSDGAQPHLINIQFQRKVLYCY